MPLLHIPFRRLRSPHGQTPTRRDWGRLVAVKKEWSRLEATADGRLADEIADLRTKLPRGADGRLPSHLLTRTLALTAEAVKRTTGKQYYDVQLLGGIVLARGCIAEMQTGEGKTLTTLLPAVAMALAGRGVHIATTNAYLAQRDCEELRPALELLGLTVGLLPEQHDETAKRVAYRQDVTFGTGYDFGFDYLRDQISARAQEREPLGAELFARLCGRTYAAAEPLQRAATFALVDEADSVLIDEGTMPLILSGSSGEPPDPRLLALAEQLANELTPDEMLVDESRRSIEFTASGWRRIHGDLGAESATLRRPWGVYVENAVRAARFLERDVDYVIRDGTVQIVDPQTGRIHSERTWRDGLHQAVEWRERVTVTPERASDARVTRQRYFRCYKQLAGMTGTTGGVEAELRHFYGLWTVQIPTHRPCRREQYPSRYFGTADDRDRAIVAEIAAEQRRGRPVLVGTRTIRHSRALAERLTVEGVPHTVLNGTQDQTEAEIVAQAGRQGTVTIATNMAGRGTDIQLDADSRAAGGLHVIAAEHHPSRRVDRQLAGRAGRQGDPGSCRVFVAAEDELFRLAESDLPTRLRSRADTSGEIVGDYSREITALQERLERRSYEMRRQMVDRDAWLDDVLETLAGRH
ncbi:MAG: translocase [Planctomycetaceae bacterium]|nr:translocase [Planctomycetaceae bacterium]